MDLVRPIDDDPWPAIGSALCVGLPLVTAVWFCPAWSGRWEPGSGAMWIGATLFTTARCVSWYGWIALRGRWSTERHLQAALVLGLPIVEHLFPDVAALMRTPGGSALDRVVHDPATLIDGAVIAASLAITALGRRHGRNPAASPTA